MGREREWRLANLANELGNLAQKGEIYGRNEEASEAALKIAGAIAEELESLPEKDLEDARMLAIRVARMSSALRSLSDWGLDPAGEALAPLAKDGRMLAFAEHPNREWARLDGTEWENLVCGGVGSLARSLASDARFWKVRAWASGGKRNEAFGAPLALVPAPQKQAAKRAAKPEDLELLARREAQEQRLRCRSLALIASWDVGFESGAIASLAGSREGSLLMMGLIASAPLERVEQARAAGLDLKALTPADAEFGFSDLAFNEDPEARLYQEARCDRRWSMGKAEREELGAIRGEGSTRRRAERWRLAIELGAPKVVLSQETGRAMRRGEWFGAGVAALEAARGGALEGGWAAMVWCHAQGAQPAFSAEIHEIEPTTRGVAGPLAFALKQGLSVAVFDTPEVWRFGALEAGDGALTALAAAGASSARWEASHCGGSAVAEALRQGIGREGLGSLAAMGADFQKKEKGDSLLVFALGLDWPESEARERISGLLAGAEAQKKGGARRLLEAKSEPSGAGAMCAAAKALSPESLAELASRGLSIKEKDAKGRGLLFWASKKYSDRSQERLMRTLSWLSEQGMDWDAKDKRGEPDSGWLARRGSAERVMSALKAAPSVAAEGLEKIALGRFSGGDRAKVERHLMGEASLDANEAQKEPETPLSAAPKARRRL